MLKKNLTTGLLLTFVITLVFYFNSRGQSANEQANAAEDGDVVFFPVDGEKEIHKLNNGETVTRNGIKGIEYTLDDDSTIFVAADPLDHLLQTLETENFFNTKHGDKLQTKLEAARKNDDTAQAKLLQKELEDFTTRCKIDTVYFSVDAFIDSYKLQRKELAAMRKDIQELKKMIASRPK